MRIRACVHVRLERHFIVGIAFVLGSCAPGLSPKTPTVEGMRLEAVLSFSAGDARDVFGTSRFKGLDWSDAAWIRLPPATGTLHYTAYTTVPTAEVPVLFLVERKPETPHLSVWTIRVNSGPANGAEAVVGTSEQRPIPAWCEEQRWLGGFFVAGAGPRASVPVIVEYRTRSGIQRLLVEPSRTIQGEPAFRVRDADLLSAAASRDERFVSVQPAVPGAVQPLSLIIAVNADGSRRAMSSGPGGAFHGSFSGLATGGIVEWQVYALNNVPGASGQDGGACSG